MLSYIFNPRKRAASREFEVAIRVLLHDAENLIPLLKKMYKDEWSGFIDNVLNGARPYEQAAVVIGIFLQRSFRNQDQAKRDTVTAAIAGNNIENPPNFLRVVAQVLHFLCLFEKDGTVGKKLLAEWLNDISKMLSESGELSPKQCITYLVDLGNSYRDAKLKSMAQAQSAPVGQQSRQDASDRQDELGTRKLAEDRLRGLIAKLLLVMAGDGSDPRDLSNPLFKAAEAQAAFIKAGGDGDALIADILSVTTPSWTAGSGLACGEVPAEAFQSLASRVVFETGTAAARAAPPPSPPLPVGVAALREWWASHGGDPAKFASQEVQAILARMEQSDQRADCALEFVKVLHGGSHQAPTAVQMLELADILHDPRWQ
jgi:hypothetical protein